MLGIMIISNPRFVCFASRKIAFGVGFQFERFPDISEEGALIPRLRRMASMRVTASAS
jgi:hypothetical protein